MYLRPHLAACSNFRYFFPPREAEDGTLEFSVPVSHDLKVASFDARDMGKGQLVLNVVVASSLVAELNERL